MLLRIPIEEKYFSNETVCILDFDNWGILNNQNTRLRVNVVELRWFDFQV